MTKVICDACANHIGIRSIMETMIKQAANIHVDIIKFQAFQANHLNPNYPDFQNNHNYYKSVELKYDDYYFLKRHCDDAKIDLLFTVFHKDLIPIVHDVTPNMVKIASPDAQNYHLIEECLAKFKSVIVSTGMSTPQEIQRLRQYPVKLMYCVSKYPTNESDIDFNQMVHYDGFSDHTLTTTSAKKAIDLNIPYIEKHFTLGRDLYGRDQKMSSTIQDFQDIIAHRDHIVKVNHYKTRWTSNAIR